MRRTDVNVTVRDIPFAKVAAVEAAMLSAAAKAVSSYYDTYSEYEEEFFPCDGCKKADNEWDTRAQCGQCSAISILSNTFRKEPKEGADEDQ